MPTEQDIIVVSDLHMGDGGPRDNFSADHKERQFNLFLDFVEGRNAQIFILGDLFDFWQANVGKVLIRWMNLLDRLARMQAVYVVGNHDADFQDLVGTNLLAHPFFERMCGPFERVIGGRRFKFMHGHELDPFNWDGTPRWGRILSILAGIMEDRKGSPLLSAGGFTEKSLLKIARGFMWTWNNSVNIFEKSRLHEKPHSLEESLTPAQDPAKIKGILSLYHKNKIQEGYDYLVAGHTHAVGRFQDWYYNCGCWVGLRTHFLEILQEGTIHVCEWKKDRPVVMEKAGLSIEDTE
ncbi:MAG: UDP-2,3-diacylglucosamine diphosphatase [Planctomycetales bacterium]|nr:UDP-2,3-diacylglucosamine diphosphatase [Planctomycetales bacterium]